MLAFSDDINVLGGRVRTVRVNGESSVLANTEIGLEISADKSKYIVMSGYQNAARSDSIKNVNNSFEIFRQFK